MIRITGFDMSMISSPIFTSLELDSPFGMFIADIWAISASSIARLSNIPAWSILLTKSSGDASVPKFMDDRRWTNCLSI